MELFLQANITTDDKNFDDKYLNFDNTIITFSFSTNKNQLLLDDTTFFINLYHDFNSHLKKKILDSTRYKTSNLEQTTSFSILTSHGSKTDINVKFEISSEIINVTKNKFAQISKMKNVDQNMLKNKFAKNFSEALVHKFLDAYNKKLSSTHVSFSQLSTVSDDIFLKAYGFVLEQDINYNSGINFNSITHKDKLDFFISQEQIIFNQKSKCSFLTCKGSYQENKRFNLIEDKCISKPLFYSLSKININPPSANKSSPKI